MRISCRLSASKGQAYTVHLELNERYGDHKGRIEHRVTMDGRVVFTLDIANRAPGQKRNGCYAFGVPVVAI